MSIQVKRRRESASFLSTFTGAVAEIVVDTTNNRIQVHDGVTPGGWPAAKLSEVVTSSRSVVSDAAHQVASSDRMIAYATLGAARSVTLCSASSYPTGTLLWIVDESGACSAANSIVVSAAEGDTVGGQASYVLEAGYASLALESNGARAWTVLSPALQMAVSSLGVGVAPNAETPLSVTANATLFSAKAVESGGTGDMRNAMSKAKTANTTSIIFQDDFSGRAELGLCGDDVFRIKVSSDGTSWTDGLVIDPATGAITVGNARTAVSDQDHNVAPTDRTVAFTSLSAPRTVNLCSAASFPTGTALSIIDETGACSETKAITIVAGGLNPSAASHV